MRYCNSCQKVTSGDPAYCNYCGKSYDIKLCSRGHPNIRSAEVCSTCGSRDLSTPHPRPSWKFRIFQVCVLILPFAVLGLLTLAYIAVFVRALFENPSLLLPLMLLGLVLGLIWLLWIHLSATIRELLFGRRSRDMRM